MTYAALTGWGKCLPPAILTNADLGTFLPTDDAWITSRTGMKERRISHVSGLEMSYVRNYPQSQNAISNNRHFPKCFQCSLIRYVRRHFVLVLSE